MAVSVGRSAKVKTTSAAATTSTGEAMTSLSATTNRTLFRITDGTLKHWTRDVVPNVYVLTTAHTNDFSVNYVQGQVTFSTALTTAEGDAVTVDAQYHTASYLPITRTWSLDQSVDMLDTTAFSTTTGDVTWRTFKAGLSQATVSLGRLVEGGSTETPAFFDRLNTDTDLVVELHAASTFKWEGYAKVSGDSYNTAVEALVSEDVSLQINGPLYYSTLA